MLGAKGDVDRMVPSNGQGEGRAPILPCPRLCVQEHGTQFYCYKLIHIHKARGLFQPT